MEPSDKWMMVTILTIIHLPEAPNPKVGPPRDTVQERNEMHFFILWSNIMHWVPLVESSSGQKILWSMEPLVK